jgi:hypothetical protein
MELFLFPHEIAEHDEVMEQVKAVKIAQEPPAPFRGASPAYQPPEPSNAPANLTDHEDEVIARRPKKNKRKV